MHYWTIYSGIITHHDTSTCANNFAIKSCSGIKLILFEETQYSLFWKVCTSEWIPRQYCKYLLVLSFNHLWFIMNNKRTVFNGNMCRKKQSQYNYVLQAKTIHFLSLTTSSSTHFLPPVMKQLETREKFNLVFMWDSDNSYTDPLSWVMQSPGISYIET